MLACIVLMPFNHILSPQAKDNGWDAHAGLVPSYTQAATITSSSNSKALSNLTDENLETHWQSEAPLPVRYISRKDLNYFQNQEFAIQASAIDNQENIFDGNLDSPAMVKITPGPAFLELTFKEPTYLQLISLKVNASNPLKINLQTEKGNQSLDYDLQKNFNVQQFDIEQKVTKIKLESKTNFQLFEFGGMRTPPTEWVTFDLGTVQPLGVIYSKHWPGEKNVSAVQVFISADGEEWEAAANLPLNTTQGIITNLKPEKKARYVKFEYRLNPVAWNKVFLWEVKLFDQYGQYGPIPHAEPSTVTLEQMLGVNGLWGWGHNMYSHMLKPRQGAALFKPVSSHGRCYHDMSWEVKDPDTAPNYAAMSEGKGTEASDWLNWDLEYKIWVDKGLNVQSTVQIHNFEDDTWDNPYKSAYNYAYRFAKHFGPTEGNGYVCTVEAGNEPWKYDAAVYREIVKGFADGVKDADPVMEVFPCALQAADPSMENTPIFKNYIGVRLPQEAANQLDGINVHAYSYVNTMLGGRIAVHPEHQNTTFRELFNAIRWRDSNMPGKKIYLSEWGWDMAGGGEDCTHDVCVSEQAGASYAVRAALMAQRLGIDRASWYFFANVEKESSLYTRSGLTASRAGRFIKKKAFYSLHSLINLAGKAYFLKVLQEDDQAWVYLLGDANGKPSHVVAWKPIEGDDLNTEVIQLEAPYKGKNAFKLDGQSANGTPVNLPTSKAGKLAIPVSSIPTLIVL